MAADEILTVTVPRSMLEAVLRRVTNQAARLRDPRLVDRFATDVRAILAGEQEPAALPAFPNGPLIPPGERAQMAKTTLASGRGYDPLWRKR